MHYTLGRVFYRKGDQERAAERFKIVASLQEQQQARDTAETQVLLAIGRGLKATAEGDLERAVRGHPGMPESHYRLGRLHLRMARRVEALRGLEIVQEFDPAGGNKNSQAKSRESDPVGRSVP